jgi:hypothetical protein
MNTNAHGQDDQALLKYTATGFESRREGSVYKVEIMEQEENQKGSGRIIRSKKLRKKNKRKPSRRKKKY